MLLHRWPLNNVINWLLFWPPRCILVILLLRIHYLLLQLTRSLVYSFLPFLHQPISTPTTNFFTVIVLPTQTSPPNTTSTPATVPVPLSPTMMPAADQSVSTRLGCISHSPQYLNDYICSIIIQILSSFILCLLFLLTIECHLIIEPLSLP